MYRIYYTDPETGEAKARDVFSLQIALDMCAYYREHGFDFVTMVSDYADMVGNSGAKMAGNEYVPQMLN